MNPIYQPKGKAKEYGDLALNIYTGCPHRCYYCFAPNVLHKDREQFSLLIEPRKNIVEETRKQIEREGITGKLIHLCFTCDPYPTGYDTTVTREIIKLLKDSGNNVQILTKEDGTRDFDLLDSGDCPECRKNKADDKKNKLNLKLKKRPKCPECGSEKGVHTVVTYAWQKYKYDGTPDGVSFDKDSEEPTLYCNNCKKAIGTISDKEGDFKIWNS